MELLTFLFLFLDTIRRSIFLILSSSASSEMQHNGEIYNEVKNHLGKHGIEDFYIKFQELHVRDKVVSLVVLIYMFVSGEDLNSN